MAKLTIALLLAFLALATAHKTTITTTNDDQNPVSMQQESCSPQLQVEVWLDLCSRYLQFPYYYDSSFRQCCQGLQNVEEQCQCEAIKQAFRDAQQQVQHVYATFPKDATYTLRPLPVVMQEIKHNAQNLPKHCNLPMKKQCPLGSIITSTTTIIDPLMPFGTGTSSQQCSQHQIQRPVNKCQRYMEQQMFSTPRTLLMSINQQQKQPELQECCKELQNLNRECQYDAFEELDRKVLGPIHVKLLMRILRPKEEEQLLRQQLEIGCNVIGNLPHQCNVDVHMDHMTCYI